MNKRSLFRILAGLSVVSLFVFLMTCGKGQNGQVAANGDVNAVAEARGLTPADMLAAAKTYVPTGKYDEYVMFASGGHAGQVFVIGLPSMRILRTIAVFTPEPWQGYGFGAGRNGV